MLLAKGMFGLANGSFFAHLQILPTSTFIICSPYQFFIGAVFIARLLTPGLFPPCTSGSANRLPGKHRGKQIGFSNG